MKGNKDFTLSDCKVTEQIRSKVVQHKFTISCMFTYSYLIYVSPGFRWKFVKFLTFQTSEVRGKQTFIKCIYNIQTMALIYYLHKLIRLAWNSKDENRLEAIKLPTPKYFKSAHCNLHFSPQCWYQPTSPHGV
jgi:hypothetical protein